jgi:LCP family protein required for cell wall assembly
MTYNESPNDFTVKSPKVPEAPVDAAPETLPNANKLQAAETVYRVSAVPTAPPPPPLSRESAARERARKRRTSGAAGGEWAWVIIAVALLGVVIMLSLAMFVALRVARNMPDTLPTAQVAFSALPTAVELGGDGIGGDVGDTLIFSDGTTVELRPWDGESRLTILLLGLDRRPGETGLQFRTDTIMLISIDPKTNRVGLMSIPRDLYVEVPGYSGLRRINEPMVLGEIREEGLGPRLAMETVQYNFGIYIHNYIIVDFQAFIGIVDAIGGIDIEIDYNISDPSYPSMNYGYDPFYLRAGQHTLNGVNALKFARTRHGDNDFRRAERQQMVLYALRQKLSQPDILPQMLTQAPLLWNSFRSNIYTGLNLEELIQLGLYIKDVPSDSISTGVLDYTYASPFTTSQGAQVLIPNRTRIATLMQEVFGEDYNQ